MKRSGFILLLMLTLQSLAQQKPATPLGTWMNEEKVARFEIFTCAGKLCGKIIWLKEPLRKGQPKRDDHNPEAHLRGRPLLGMVFMKDFVYKGNHKWDEGSIYDPKSGKTYSCYLKLINPDLMQVKGYIGISLIGRSQTWSRVK